MRIPSYQKIEKQAKKYAETHWEDMPEEWYEKYRKLNSEHKRLSIEWDKIREKCPGNENGNKCICQTFPEYETIMLKQLSPLTKEINTMWDEKANRSRSLYLKELCNLQRMREAKEKYMKFH